jgi:hypothetical protein
MRFDLMNRLATTALLLLFMPIMISGGLFTGAAGADNGQPLLPREAVLDNAPTATAASTAAPSTGPGLVATPASGGTEAIPPGPGGANNDNPKSSTTLNGAVSRSDNLPAMPSPYTGNGAGSVPPFDPRAFFSAGQMPRGGTLNSGTSDERLRAILNAVQAARVSGAYSVFLNGNLTNHGAIKFGRRTPTMSPDQFRQLEHGVIGLDSTVTFGKQFPVVRECYATCPAALAGIKPGDLLFKANDHVFQPGEGQAVTWKIIPGKAGTPVDITVLRDGQELTFHLIRMNIEDIKDDRIRTTYEMLLSALGPPGQ